VIYSFMLTSGAGNLFDDKCNVTFNTPQTVRTLDLYQKLLKFSPPDATSFSWGEPQALLNSGASAMAVEKGQYLSPFEKDSGRPASDLGMAHIPMPATDGQEGTIYYSNAVMVFSQDAAKQAAAGKFISYLLSQDVYGKFLTAEPGLFLPLTQTGLKSDALWSDPVIAKYKPYVEEMIAYSQNGALFGFSGGNVCPEITAISAQNLLAQTVQQIAVGGMTPEQAAEWGQKQMEDAVTQFRQSQ
jgi:multiple sugar transport system substrate-binding protein